MIAVAVLAIAIGVLVAVTTGRHGSGDRHRPRSNTAARATSELTVAASYLGMSATRVRERLRAGESLGELAQAKPGGSESGLTAALLAARSAQIEREHLSTQREREKIAQLRRRLQAQIERHRRIGDLALSAGYLGLSEATLRTRLRHGQTLAQIATAGGRSVAGLASALVASKREQLKSEVESGAITKAQERSSSASLPSRVDARLHRKLLQREALE